MARNRNDPLVPDAQLVAIASSLVHQLRPQLARYALTDADTGDRIELPEPIANLLRDALTLLAQNNAVALQSVDLELTTNQAADLLNISRTFLIRLLEKGDLPYRLVGTHRRVLLEDALAYRDKMRENAEAAVAEVAKIDQEIGLDN